MTSNRRGSGDLFHGTGGFIDRSVTQGGIPNNSNIGSFAAHKANKNDKTNASVNPMMNWLEDGKAKRKPGGGRRGTLKTKKGDDGDALEFSADIIRQ